MKYEVGSIVKGKVTGIETYGIFVEFDDKEKGLIHISEIHDGFVKNINEYAKINDEIFVRIIARDSNGRLILSIKGIKENPSIVNWNSEGFKDLKNKLPEWIDEKLKELNNN